MESAVSGVVEEDSTSSIGSERMQDIGQAVRSINWWKTVTDSWRGTILCSVSKMYLLRNLETDDRPRESGDWWMASEDGTHYDPQADWVRKTYRIYPFKLGSSSRFKYVSDFVASFCSVIVSWLLVTN
jgi:hypothetical protein